MEHFKKLKPEIEEACFIAENATIIGNVTLHKDASIWFQTVIRGDNDHIEIGEASNIQDHCTLHTDLHHVLRIGNRVSVGHGAILHGATIEDECLIGMGAIILNGAIIGKHSIIGAGAIVTEHQVIPENSVVIGCPARVVKKISNDQINQLVKNALHYVALGKEYRDL